jgi:hypothetical protein
MSLGKLGGYLATHRGREYLLRRLLERVGICRFQYCLVSQPVARHPFVSKQSQSLSVQSIGRNQYRIDWFPRPRHIVVFALRKGLNAGLHSKANGRSDASG